MAARGDEDEGYEAPERLMDKDDVLQICKIMGFAESTVNNYEEMPEPTRYGAGNVNPFKEGEKLSFLEPTPKKSQNPPKSENGRQKPASKAAKRFPDEKIPRMDLDFVFNEFFISRYSFIPPFLQLYHEVGTQESSQCLDDEDLEANFPNNGYSFDLPSEIVKQRAAWSWWRTGVFYEESAKQVQQGGAGQKALGLSTLGSSAATELEKIVRGLNDKAARAKAHALSLFPDFLDKESPLHPSWGERFSDADEEYYEEMAENHARVQRVKLSEKYKGYAMMYLCEAISLYLEWKKENPEKCKEFVIVPFPGSISGHFFGGGGGIAKLWSEASQWSQNLDVNGWYRRRFREWWIRAAMARGHAEWLVSEMEEIDRGVSRTGYNTADSWRLLPPAPVGCYTEDCVFRSFLIVTGDNDPGAGPLHKDDAFYTEYVKAQIQGRDFSWVRYGERNYNFGPGAPDSVFHGKAKTGWAKDYLGLFPADSSMMSIETGYFERYCRKGLSHHMSSVTPSYERALAICVDDIILEWEQKRYIAIFTGRDNAGANILADLEADVMRLTRLRVQLTEFEAEKYCFQEELQSTLTHHFDRIGALLQSRPFQETEQSATLCYLAKVKQMLNPMLEPWYGFDVLFRITDGKPMCVLGDMQGHLALTQETVGEWIHAKKVNYMLDYYRLKNIYRHVERIRTALLNGGRNLREEDWYFAEIFREFLETGDETRLPFIKSGLEKKREQTISDFRKEKLYSCNGDCGCAFDDMEKEEVQEHKFRKSLAPKAHEEREQIKQVFIQHKTTGLEDRNKDSGDGGSGIPIELILSLLQGQGNAGAGIPASLLMDALDGGGIGGSATIKSNAASQGTKSPANLPTKESAFPTIPPIAANTIGSKAASSSPFIAPVPNPQQQVQPQSSNSLFVSDHPAAPVSYVDRKSDTVSTIRSLYRSRAPDPAREAGDMSNIDSALHPEESYSDFTISTAELQARRAARRHETEKHDELRRAELLDDAVTYFNDLHFKFESQALLPGEDDQHQQQQQAQSQRRRPPRQQLPLQRKRDRVTLAERPLIFFGDSNSEPASQPQQMPSGMQKDQLRSHPQPHPHQKQEKQPNETPESDQTNQRKKSSSFRKRLRRFVRRIFNRLP